MKRCGSWRAVLNHACSHNRPDGREVPLHQTNAHLPRENIFKARVQSGPRRSERGRQQIIGCVNRLTNAALRMKDVARTGRPTVQQRELIMSSTQSRRAATLVGTDRLVDSYAAERAAESELYADV